MIDQNFITEKGQCLLLKAYYSGSFRIVNDGSFASLDFDDGSQLENGENSTPPNEITWKEAALEIKELELIEEIDNERFRLTQYGLSVAKDNTEKFPSLIIDISPLQRENVIIQGSVYFRFKISSDCGLEVESGVSVNDELKIKPNRAWKKIQIYTQTPKLLHVVR